MSDGRSKLTPELEQECVRKCAEGYTLRQVCAWLLTEHGIALSHVSLHRRIASKRGEVADIAKAIVREKVQTTLSPALDCLDLQRRRIARLSTRLFRSALDDPEGTEIYLKAAEQLRKVVDTQLKYSGADEPDNPDVELQQAAERVRGRLARLAPDSGADADSGGTGADSG